MPSTASVALSLSLGLSLLGALPGDLAHADTRARLVQAASASAGGVSAQVTHVSVPDQVVLSGVIDDDELVVEAEIKNTSAGEVTLDLSGVGLVLHAAGRGPENRLRLPATRMGGDRGGAAGPLRIRPGESVWAWFEFADLPPHTDRNGLPQRIALELRLAGQTLELVLADPGQGSPRWELPAARSAALWTSMSAFVAGGDLGGVGASFAGGALALGPLVLRSGFDLVIGSRSAGFGGDLAISWPAIQLPKSGARRRFALGPTVGGRALLLAPLAGSRGGANQDGGDAGADGGPADGSLAGVEVGLSFFVAVDRQPHSPFPLVRPPSRVGTTELRLAYVHWFGDGLASGGAPGFALRLGHALF